MWPKSLDRRRLMHACIFLTTSCSSRSPSPCIAGFYFSCTCMLPTIHFELRAHLPSMTAGASSSNSTPYQSPHRWHFGANHTRSSSDRTPILFCPQPSCLNSTLHETNTRFPFTSTQPVLLTKQPNCRVTTATAIILSS
jgi:hypothetical protein